MSFECEHIQSLHFCPRATYSEEYLSESALDLMGENLGFSLHRKKYLLNRQQEAFANNMPL